MQELYKAIITKFSASPHNDFYNDISGRLYNTQAPQNVVFPYAVFFVVSDIHEWTFTTSFENVLLQFSLFSTNESVQEVENMFDHCKSLFDWCVLTITGDTFLYMRRESSQLFKDDRPTWMRTIDYRILVED